jgi:hypothetical protein
VGCLNVFGMALSLVEAPFTGGLRWILGEGLDGYPGRIPGLSILLDISPQNRYAVFCFIKRGLNCSLPP